MFDILFSLQFVWITLVIVILSVAAAFVCAHLHHHLLQAFAGEWLTQHIYCPLIRICILVCMTLLLFPMMVSSASYGEMAALFTDQAYLTRMVNTLMVSGLLLTFFPLLQHPALSMPIMGVIATAILFHRFYNNLLPGSLTLVPAAGDGIKILVLMIGVYWVGRWLIEQLSTYVDHRFIVTGSRLVITDIVYLILQIPIMLAYANSLLTQNAVR